MAKKPAARVMLSLAMTMTAVASAAPTAAVAADDGAAAHDLLYSTEVIGRPFEPYAEIPGEIAAGFPSALVQLERSPSEFCQAVSGIYEGGMADGVIESVTESEYQNPTRAWATNPATSRQSQAQVATFPGGPAAAAKCESPSSGSATGTFGGYVSDQLSVTSSSVKSTNVKAPDGSALVTETASHITGIAIGDVSIRSVDSWLKVEWKPNQEPVASYRIEVAGVRNGQDVLGAGGAKGIVLSGQNIAGSDLVKQFNDQAREHGSSEQLGKMGLRILEPRFTSGGYGRYSFEISALDGVAGAPTRKGQPGQGFGMRLGISRAFGAVQGFGPS